MPSLPGDAGGAAAGAQEGSQGSSQIIVCSQQQAANNHEDTPPAERYMNNEVLLQTVILISIRGLGNLLLLWSTVVLLGGFVSNLPNIDFGCITFISVLQSLRVFNAMVDEQYRYLIEILLDRVKKYTKEKNSASNTAAASGIHVTQLVKKLMSLIAWVLIPIPLAITVFYPLIVFIVHIVLASVRLHVYWHRKSGDEAKMNKAIFSFYILTLIQGVLYLLWYILDFGSHYWLVGETAKRCKFGDSWGKDSVRQYLASTKSRCLSNIAAERSLVKFASGLLDSDGKADFLSGARMVNTFIEEGKLPVQELIRSSRSRVQKLLMMLAWKQPDDRDIRFQAAKIVAHVAGDIDIAQFPGTLGCICSLIEPSQDNYSLYRSSAQITSGDGRLAVENGEAKMGMERHAEQVDECDLILQGFSILDKLTLDKHNSIEILQDQALLTHIIAWVRSKPFIGHMDHGNHWPTILKSCLNVLVRLTSLPEQNASHLNHIIKVQIPIFISGYASKPELQAKGMEIFANVFYLDKDDKNRNTHQKRKKFLVVIRGLFLSCTSRTSSNNPNEALKDGVIVRAGEALSMLSANEINCHTLYSLDNGIAEQLDTIIFGGPSISVVYRSLAAEIEARVYNNTILKTYIYDDVTSKEKRLHEVVGLLSQLSGYTTPQGQGDDDNNKAHFYRLQGALVYNVDVLINTVMVQDEGRLHHTVGAEEATAGAAADMMDRRKMNASLFKQKILDSLHGDFVQVLKRLIDTDSNVATTGRLEVVKRTASLVRSMVGGRFLVENLKRDKIIESLKNANNVLSGVDSWEIFNSNQRRGLKWQSTLESLINDIQKLLDRTVINQ